MRVRFPLGAHEVKMLENKRNYWWFAVISFILGVSVFMISLISAVSGPREVVGERQLYFGREILPDHVFYPVVALGDRVELWWAADAEKPVVQRKLARKRLEAATELYRQGKAELAWVTLRKAHQYVLQASQGVRGEQEQQAQELRAECVQQYTLVHKYMPDSQWAGTTRMIEELERMDEDKL